MHMLRPNNTNPDAINLLVNKIRTEFPRLQFSDYHLASAGWDHDVVIIENALVFRFPKNDEYTRSLKSEIYNLQQLHEAISANIPHYTYIAQDESVAGYEMIRGAMLSKTVMDIFDANEKHCIATQLADLLSAIHGVENKSFDTKRVKGSYLPVEQEKLRPSAIEYLKNVLSTSDYDSAMKILKDVDDIIAQTTPVVLTHGDVYANNLLWDNQQQKLGLIDFSDMSMSDPAIDFAELYDYGDMFVQEVYQYYTGPKDEDFLDRARTYHRWSAVYNLTRHIKNSTASLEDARKAFDEVK